VGDIPAIRVTAATERSQVTAATGGSETLSAQTYSLFITARGLDVLLWVPASHLSVVTRLDDGAQWEYEGQPEREVLGDFGRIVVTRRPYRPRLDRQIIRVPLPFLGPVSDAAARLDAQVARLNAAAVPYVPLFGPNSNTVVRTFLIALGLGPLQPAAIAPGFEHTAL
jgi:hypothetical protein